jgi:hypothetical protein
LKDSQRVLDWLLEPDQPAVQYFAMTDLLEVKKTDPEIRMVHSQILKRGWAKDILAKQHSGGYWEKRESLYTPKYISTFWRMIVLSDFAITAQENKGLQKACQLFFEDWLRDDETLRKEAEVCQFGNLGKLLALFGYSEDQRVKKVFDWLIDAQKEDGGWHCFPSKTGSLDGWEALVAFAALPKQKRSRRMNSAIERGAEFYLQRALYKQGRRYEPWFRFHYPNHYYYDLLVGLDVITSLGFANDKRLGYSLRLLNKKRRADGAWNLDAVHPDLGSGANYRLRKEPVPFALEKAGKPSKWITLKALQVLKRVEGAS